jgi:hypothetical protein
MKKQGTRGGQYGGADRTSGQPHGASEDVKDKVASAAGEVRDRGEELLDEGREKAQELGQAAGEMARSRADEQIDRVVDGIKIFADVLRQGGNDLSGERRQYRSVLNSVADRAEGVSQYLDGRDVQSVTRDVRRFARENTALFLGGAFALGLIGARFLKSSSDEGQDEDDWRYREGGMQNRYDRMLPESGTRGGYGAGAGTSYRPGGGMGGGMGGGSFGGTTGTGGGMGGVGGTPGTGGTGGLGGTTGTGDRPGGTGTGSEPGSRGRS